MVSLVSGTVWEELVGVALLEEVCRWQWALDLVPSQLAPYLLLVDLV